MYFLNVRLLYSLTVAFGMGTIAEILAHPIIKNIGKRNESVTSSTTLKLLNCLKNEVGQLSVSGSANWKRKTLICWWISYRRCWNKSLRTLRAHFYTLLSGVSCVLRSFILRQQKKTAWPRMLRHFVPSRWLHPLAPLKRLSLVDLPSANSIKCCSPPASLKANKMNFMEQANRNLWRWVKWRKKLQSW